MAAYASLSAAQISLGLLGSHLLEQFKCHLGCLMLTKVAQISLGLLGSHLETVGATKISLGLPNSHWNGSVLTYWRQLE